MAYRTVMDQHGVVWEIWSVLPGMSERRDERALPAPPVFERRRRREARPSIAPTLATGWLAFRSVTSRRRLVTPPSGWEFLTDAQLLELLDRSEQTGKPRRLIE